jgi:hypothetical protein
MKVAERYPVNGDNRAWLQQAAPDFKGRIRNTGTRTRGEFEVRRQATYGNGEALMESQTFVLPSDGATLVTLTRHAGVGVAAQLHDQLLSAEVSAPVQFDWSQAEHMEACVLLVLLACRYDDVARGQLTIRGDNPDVRKYLELSGFSSFFPVNTQSSANPSAAMCYWRPEISTWKSDGMELCRPPMYSSPNMSTVIDLGRGVNPLLRASAGPERRGSDLNGDGRGRRARSLGNAQGRRTHAKPVAWFSGCRVKQSLSAQPRK